MAGGGSCEAFAVDRGDDALGPAAGAASRQRVERARRAARVPDPRRDQGRTGRDRASRSSRVTTPSVFGAPFFVMERIEGSADPDPRARAMGGGAGNARPRARGAHRRARRDPRRRLARAAASGDLAHDGEYLPHQITRWLAQLESYESRELPSAIRVAEWLGRAPARGSTERAVSRRLQARQRALRARVAAEARRRRRLGDGRNRRSARRPRVGADLSPRARRHDPARRGEGTDVRGRSRCPIGASSSSGTRGSRDATRLRSVGTTCSPDGSSPIALEGSYAKFLRGQSDKPLHEFFGMQADLLLESAEHIIEAGSTP